MLHPDQFQVNEAWIAFKLNDAPIHTEQDGDFDYIALMDAASCFILGFAPVRTMSAGPTQFDSRQLLNEGRAHKNQLPKTLFLSKELPVQFLEVEAAKQGIVVVGVPEEQLLLFIDDAREGFRERFGSGSGP